VSLTGEIRPVPGLEKRSRACREMGFGRLIGPAAGDAAVADAAGYLGVERVREAVVAVFGGRKAGENGAR
jgi:predicted ATP-dependent serine protease